MIDLTPVFQAIIALLAALITYKLIPWIKSKTTLQQQENLRIAARIAVNAAEQVYGAGRGQEKLDYAVEALENAGYIVDKDMILAAIENAVRQMNMLNETMGFFEEEEPEEAEEGPEQAEEEQTDGEQTQLDIEE